MLVTSKLVDLINKIIKIDRFNDRRIVGILAALRRLTFPR